MLRLLKIEWLKLKHYRTFWILSALYCISIFGLNNIAFYIQQKIYEAKQAKGMAEAVIGSPPYSFPQAWQMTSYMSGFLLFFPGLLMIIFVTNEYSFKTHRQNIIDGWSRWDFISVKMALAVLLSVFSTVVVFLAAIVFGSISGGDPVSFTNFYYLGYFFIQALSYTMMGLLFAVLLKRGGLAIGLFFLYSVVLENIAAGVLNKFANYSGRYLPLKSAGTLIPLPVFENLQKQILKTPNYTALLIVALLYLLLYFLAVKTKFERDDL